MLILIDWFWSVKKLRDVSTGEVTCIFWYYSICPRQVKSYTITGIITRSWINNLKLIQKLKNYYFCHYKKYIPCWPLLHQPLLAVCSRSNSHRQTYNAGLFNAICGRRNKGQQGIRLNLVETLIKGHVKYVKPNI